MKEKTLGESICVNPVDDIIRRNNRELNKPIHMDPGPYEIDDADFCPYCGDELPDHDIDECKKEFRRIDITRKSLP